MGVTHILGIQELPWKQYFSPLPPGLLGRMLLKSGFPTQQAFLRAAFLQPLLSTFLHLAGIPGPGLLAKLRQMVAFMVEQREGSNRETRSMTKLELGSLAEMGCLEDSEPEGQGAQV